VEARGGGETVMQREHISTQFEKELNELRQKILSMGHDLMQMITTSMDALVERNEAQAESVIEFDHRINRQEVDIDELAVKIIALRQPAAGDLRFIIMALKISTDLERIGDLCVNLAERSVELTREPQLKPYIDLPKMAEACAAMIRDVLTAFLEGDADLAQEVADRDDVLDKLNDQVFRELLTFMMEDPKTIGRATRLMFVSKYLERIADHATNIAEMVIYMVKGKDIRHLGHLEEKV
jgi:phosphate transport system protein